MRKSFLKKICSLSLLFLVWAGVASGIRSEALTYNIRYMWLLPMGKIQFTLEPYIMAKKDVSQISVSYKASGWFSWAYPISGKINSYIDIKSLLPLRYEEFYSYGWETAVNTVLIYDKEKETLFIDRNGEKESKEMTYDTFDPLSALYAVRVFNWDVGLSKEMILNNHQNYYQLSITCVAREKKQGTDAWYLIGNISELGSGSSNRTRLEFEKWISTDESRTLLKLMLHTRLGYISMTLPK
jgi:hypothetical protein